jgi:ribosome recycling factor
VTDDLSFAEQKMARVIAALERDLQRIRTGAASASLVEAVSVDDHGRRARLIDVATITIPDPRQIVIVPWDPSSLRAIGTAISQTRIGLTPTIDGPAIRLYVPGMTEDRRRELVALVHKRADQARVELRSVRHEALASIRARERQRAIGADDVRRETARLQGLTDRHVAEVDRLGQDREASILRL